MTETVAHGNVRVVESPTGLKTHVTDDGKVTRCKLTIEDGWIVRKPGQSGESITCKWCNKTNGTGKNGQIVLEPNGEMKDLSIAAVTDMQMRSGMEVLIPREIIVQDMMTEEREQLGAYTHVLFQVVDPETQDNFNLIGLCADDARTLYFSLRSYKDELMKQLQSTDNLEEEILLTGFLSNVNKWVFDLEEKIGHLPLVSFG